MADASKRRTAKGFGSTRFEALSRGQRKQELLAAYAAALAAAQSQGRAKSDAEELAVNAAAEAARTWDGRASLSILAVTIAKRGAKRGAAQSKARDETHEAASHEPQTPLSAPVCWDEKEGEGCNVPAVWTGSAWRCPQCGSRVDEEPKPKRKQLRKRGAQDAEGRALATLIDRESRVVARLAPRGAAFVADALALSLVGLCKRVADAPANGEPDELTPLRAAGRTLKAPDDLAVRLTAYAERYRRTEGPLPADAPLGLNPCSWFESAEHAPAPRRGRRRAEPRVIRHSDGATNAGQLWTVRRLDIARAIVRHGLELCGLSCRFLDDAVQAAGLRERRKWRAAVEEALASVAADKSDG